MTLIQESSPDLVITDFRMQVLDGMEWIRQVVSTEGEGISKPSFIIISGYHVGGRRR